MQGSVHVFYFAIRLIVTNTVVTLRFYFQEYKQERKKKKNCVICYIIAVLDIKITTFWYVTLCSFVDRQQGFLQICSLPFVMKIEVSGISET
jgi:hypothetical protein